MVLPGLLASDSVTYTPVVPATPVQSRSIVKSLGVVLPCRLKSIMLTVPRATVIVGVIAEQVGCNKVTVKGPSICTLNTLKSPCPVMSALVNVLGAMFPASIMSPDLISSIVTGTAKIAHVPSPGGLRLFGIYAVVIPSPILIRIAIPGRPVS